MLQAFAYNEATKILVDYWCSLPRPGGTLCPARSDFRMMDVSEISDQLFVDERHNADNICVVQSGSTINKLLGADLTGFNILELLPPDQFALERAYFQALAGQPCAGYITRLSTQATGRSFVYRSTHLPLLTKEGTVGFWVGTGAIFEENTYPPNARITKFGQFQMLEREYFDIGAGVPVADLKSPDWLSPTASI